MTDDSATLRAIRCYDALVAFFNTPEGYSEFGWHGDSMDWPPERTAIEAMKKFLSSRSSWATEKAELERQLAEADECCKQMADKAAKDHGPIFYAADGSLGRAIARHASRSVTAKE